MGFETPNGNGQFKSYLTDSPFQICIFTVVLNEKRRQRSILSHFKLLLILLILSKL